MKDTSRWIAAAVGVLGVFCASPPARAQLVASSVRVAALASGAIRGQVQDEAGTPLAGVLVSALGSASAVDVTDRTGRFELRSLPPGPYLVRARLSGFIAPRGQVVQVLPSGNALYSIALRHVQVVAGVWAFRRHLLRKRKCRRRAVAATCAQCDAKKRRI